MYADSVKDINSVFRCCPDVSLCGKSSGTCTLGEVPTKYAGKFWAPVSGPVPIAGYFGTFALLASLNNISLSWLGDGVDLDKVVSWYPLSLDGVLNIADNKWAARSFASTLAAQILLSIEQAVTGKPIAALDFGPGKKFVYMAGHDTNLVLLRQLLSLQWLTKGWVANAPPPGSMLLFELSERNSAHYVTIKFVVATPSQIRDAATFSSLGETPGSASVALPGCSGDGIACEYGEFKQVMLRAISVDCVLIPELQSAVRGLMTPPGGSDGMPAWTVATIIISVVCLTTIVVVATIVKSRRQESSYESIE